MLISGLTLSLSGCICRAPLSHQERLWKLSLTLTSLLHTVQQQRRMIRKFSSSVRSCQSTQDGAKSQVKRVRKATAPNTFTSLFILFRTSDMLGCVASPLGCALKCIFDRWISHTGWSQRQEKDSPSTSRLGSPDSGQNLASDTAEVLPSESVRGRKACKDASVNALAQRRYHQKLKVRICSMPCHLKEPHKHEGLLACIQEDKITM